MDVFRCAKCGVPNLANVTKVIGHWGVGVAVITASGLWSPSLGQKGELPKEATLQADALIEAFFTQRTGNLETVMDVRDILNYTLTCKTAYDQAFLKERGDKSPESTGARRN